MKQSIIKKNYIFLTLPHCAKKVFIGHFLHLLYTWELLDFFPQKHESLNDG
jgi:hypothetical protein